MDMEAIWRSVQCKQKQRAQGRNTDSKVHPEGLLYRPLKARPTLLGGLIVAHILQLGSMTAPDIDPLCKSHFKYHMLSIEQHLPMSIAEMLSNDIMHITRTSMNNESKPQTSDHILRVLTTLSSSLFLFHSHSAEGKLRGVRTKNIICERTSLAHP